MKRIEIVWAVAGLVLFTASQYLNGFVINHDSDKCKFGYEISEIYLVFAAFTVAIITLMISTRLKQYAIEYKHPSGTIRWMPQNYYVEDTIGTDWYEPHKITDDAQYISNRKKVKPRNAASISAFCASKGSTSNKLLNTASAWMAGTMFVVGAQFVDKIDKYAFISSGIGLLSIGMAESKYNSWAWAHIVGLAVMLGGILTMIVHAYGYTDIRPISLIVVIIGFILAGMGNKRKGVIRASISISLEFIMLYMGLIFATWKYVFACAGHSMGDIDEWAI